MWSVILPALGLTALVLVDRRPVLSWIITIVDEVVWIVYAVVTCQYGFIVTALAYAVVAIGKLRSRPWTRKGRCGNDVQLG
jgi:hypothetical protein